jgi:hypothetical protein
MIQTEHIVIRILIMILCERFVIILLLLNRNTHDIQLFLTRNIHSNENYSMGSLNNADMLSKYV